MSERARPAPMGRALAHPPLGTGAALCAYVPPSAMLADGLLHSLSQRCGAVCHHDAGRFHGFDLAFRIALAAGDNRAATRLPGRASTPTGSACMIHFH